MRRIRICGKSSARSEERKTGLGVRHRNSIDITASCRCLGTVGIRPCQMIVQVCLPYKSAYKPVALTRIRFAIRSSSKCNHPRAPRAGVCHVRYIFARAGCALANLKFLRVAHAYRRHGESTKTLNRCKAVHCPSLFAPTFRSDIFAPRVAVVYK